MQPLGKTLYLATTLSLLVLAGCTATQHAASTVCSVDKRAPLLKTTLVEWTPSPSFTVGSGLVAWIQVTKEATSSGGLFGTMGGIAELHSIPNGAAPNVVTSSNGDRESQDPAIVIQKALTWQKLSLSHGDWQLYSASNPGIEVVSCPGSS